MGTQSRKVRIGSAAYAGRNGSALRGEAEVEIELRPRPWGVELSICGSIWKQDGSDIISGGQNADTLLAAVDRWDVPREAFEWLVKVWDRWHLNGMRAGCQHQRALGWRVCPGHYGTPGKTCSNPGEPEPVSADDMKQAQSDLRQHGVAPVSGRSYRCAEDRLSQPCPECGYKYGSAWLREPLPADVERSIRSWPSIDPATTPTE